MLPLQMVLTAVVFVGAFLALSFGWWSIQTRRDARQRQLSMRAGNLMEDERVLHLRREDALGRDQGPLRGHLTLVLRRAGDPRREQDLLISMGLLGAAGLFVCLWVLPFPGALAGVLVGLVPYLGVRSTARRRNLELTEQLPDAIDLIGRTLRAGRAFSDALRLASTELPSPISEELVQVSEEHRLGIELRECMHNLLARNPVNWDMRLFVSSVLLQRETGGNLIEMLDHLAETIRERLIFEGKVRALTAEVRFSALVLGSLPFVVAAILLIMQPGYLSPLVESRLGRAMLGGGLTSLALGALTMRRLAQVEAA